MKFIKYILLLLIVGGCTYDFPDPVLPSAGTADFTKYVSVGNSLTAGYMDGALYTRGQNSSYPLILATQFKEVGGGEFVQPDINSDNGQYLELPDGSVLGRLTLYTNATTGSTAPGPLPTGDKIADYTGPTVNNFGVPGIKVTEALFPGYGSLNDFYGRFASDKTSSTVIGEASAAGATFFSLWLGNNDVLGYATNGASGSDGGINPGDMTDLASFTAAYNASVDAMLAGGAKGIVANIPSVTAIPYFELVPYNSIPLDEATAAFLNSAQAFGGYNQALDLLVAGIIPGFTLSQEEADKRKVTYQAGNNPILIHDDGLDDLSGVLGALNPALAVYGQTRQINSDELVTLPAASVLGTPHPLDPDPDNATIIWGVSFPIGDEYILTTAEIDLVTSRTNEFNAAISATVAANSANLALLDVNAIFSSFKGTGAVINGSPLDATIFPPFGAFSVDGVHLNGRGYGYVANLMIEAINEKFGSTVPLANPNDFPGNDFPIVQ